jgi:hypothetical protein
MSELVDDRAFPDRVSINGGPMTPCRVTAVEVAMAPAGKPRAPRPGFNAVYDTVRQYRISYDLPPADPFRVAPAGLDAAIRGAIDYEQDVTLRAALLAVLDRHAPSDDLSIAEAAGRYAPTLVCRGCPTEARGRAAWPCEDVVAIAKALGIEVNGA